MARTGQVHKPGDLIDMEERKRKGKEVLDEEPQREKPQREKRVSEKDTT